MGWAKLLQKETADCLSIAGHCWVSGRFSSVVLESGISRSIIENCSSDIFLFCMRKLNCAVLNSLLSKSPHFNHKTAHPMLLWECIKRTLLKNCLFASCGRALVLVMSLVSIAVWCSVSLQFWLQLISYLLWRAGILALGPFYLLLCVLFYIWCLSPFLH